MILQKSLKTVVLLNHFMDEIIDLVQDSIKSLKEWQLFILFHFFPNILNIDKKKKIKK